MEKTDRTIDKRENTDSKKQYTGMRKQRKPKIYIQT